VTATHVVHANNFGATPSLASKGFSPIKVARALRYTPLHPQWLAFRNEREDLEKDVRELQGVILDIGCADKKPNQYMSTSCSYVGLDYYRTAVDWYHTKPDVFGDAQQLPIAHESVDHVLLLDVLEHLARPEECIQEIKRVLKPNGTLILKVPFMYPIHDAPLDFRRWTIHGLRELAKTQGFAVEREAQIGDPLSSAALLANIAVSKTILAWVGKRSVLSLLVVVAPFQFLTLNALAWLFSHFVAQDAMMAFSYRQVWRRP
jgi:SAM-dependent methyltransferase